MAMKDYYGGLNIDIGYLFRIVRASVTGHWGKVLAFTALVSVTAFLLSLRVEPTYQAKATMHVAQRDTAVFDVREMMMKRRDPAYQATQVGVIESRRLVESVVRQHSLHERQSFVEEQQSALGGVKDFVLGTEPKDLTERELVQIAAEDLAESLMVTPRAKSYLIDIIVQRADPEEAALVANSLAGAYINEVRQQEKDDTQRSQDWMLERVQEVRQLLQAAKTELQIYKEQENIIGDSKRSQGIVASEVDTLSKKYLESRQERRSLETMYNQILNFEQNRGDLQGFSAVQKDPVIQNVKSELLDLEKTISELSKRYGPEHRRMIELESKIEATTTVLNQQTQRVIAAIKSNYELARRNKSFHEANLQNSNDKVQDLSRKQFRLIDLEQSVETQRDIYEALLKRLNRSEATGDDVNTNVRLVDPAQPPRLPVSNKATTLVILAAILGFFFSTLAAVLREWFDASIFRPADVESKLGMTAVAQVPLVAEASAGDEGVPASYTYYMDHPFSSFSEAVRGARSALMLSSLGRKKNRILVTSTIPSEGKTSISIGLAAAFGQTRKTVLIDADLRRPSVHSLLIDETARRPLGLSDLCIGSAEEEDCIHTIQSLGIDVIPAGTITPNPQELFCSSEFSELLNRIGDRYDVMIVDSPPCGGLADAHMLSAQVDQMAYVVKSGEAPVQKIRSTLLQLQNINAPLVGVILNQVSTRDDPYSYYYYSSESDMQDSVKPISATG